MVIIFLSQIFFFALRKSSKVEDSFQSLNRSYKDRNIVKGENYYKIYNEEVQKWSLKMGSEGGEGGGRARLKYVQFEDRNSVCTARSSPLRLRKYGLNWYVTVPTHGQRHRMTLHTSNTGSGIWVQDQGPRSKVQPFYTVFTSFSSFCR